MTRILARLSFLLGVMLLLGGQIFVPTVPFFLTTSCTSYTGPGDVVSGAAGWWGLRAYSCALAHSGASTTPVIDVRGSTTGTSCTIYLLGDGTGGIDLTTAGSGGTGNQCLLGATTFCSSTNTNCTVSKIYDQSGNGITLSQSTTANQPTLTISCVSSLPCMTFNGTSTGLLTSGNVTIANPSTLIGVGERTGHTTSYQLIFGWNTQNPGIGWPNSANKVLYAPCSGNCNITPAGNDNVWYAMVGSSTTTPSNSNIIYYNGSSGSNSSAPTGATGVIAIGSGRSDYVDGPVTEASFYSGTAFSSTQASNMISNIRTYWGF